MWITLLNLSGEVPLSDYQTSGAIIVGTLSVTACAIFAIPVGALGSGFEEVISAMKDDSADGDAEETIALRGGGLVDLTVLNMVPFPQSSPKGPRCTVRRRRSYQLRRYDRSTAHSCRLR